MSYMASPPPPLQRNAHAHAHAHASDADAAVKELKTVLEALPDYRAYGTSARCHTLILLYTWRPYTAIYVCVCPTYVEALPD